MTLQAETLYDHEFVPLKIEGDLAVVADESQWERIESLNQTDHNNYERWANGGGPNECLHGISRGVRCFQCHPSTIRVRNAFVDWKGPIVNSDGIRLWRMDTDRDIETTDPMQACDVWKRLFTLIDSCLNLLFVLEVHAKDMGGVRDHWPLRDDGTESGEYDETFFENVILSLVTSTQAELESGGVELLKCRDSCKSVVAKLCPTEEMDLTDWIGLELDRNKSYRRESKFGGQSKVVEHIEIGGNQPIQLEIIESLIKQADEAGVPVWNGVERYRRQPHSGRIVTSSPIPEHLKRRERI